jgi:lysophospholipase L1-like esterase
MLTDKYSRKSFLEKIALAGLSATLPSPVRLLPSAEASTSSIKQDHLLFLFQGDSITDGNRGRNNDPNHIMGHGYAFSIASRVGARFPAKALTFYNRGISGNTIPDLIARWQKDTLELKPDVVSILIGVNDSDVAIRQKDTDATRKYEEGYRVLINQTKRQLLDSLLVLCEPFIAPVGRVKENWSNWQNEMQKKQEVVQRLSIEYRTLFVPLQKVFDDAAKQASADYWIWDGIHPTVAGHELIVQAWLKQVSKQLHFLKKLL